MKEVVLYSRCRGLTLIFLSFRGCPSKPNQKKERLMRNQKLILWCQIQRQKTLRQPPTPKRSDGSPSDESSGTLCHFFRRESSSEVPTLVSTGGRIPAGTLLFPVRPAFALTITTTFIFSSTSSAIGSSVGAGREEVQIIYT